MSEQNAVSVNIGKTGEVRIVSNRWGNLHGGPYRTYYGTTKGIRSAFYVDGTQTSVCPCEGCDSAPHIIHVSLSKLTEVSIECGIRPDTLVLGCCDSGHEFGGIFEDQNGRKSARWFQLTHMDCVLESLTEELDGGRPLPVKTWPNDQIIAWIFRTIRESENGKVSGIDLEVRSREANIPMDRFKAIRAELRACKKIACTHPKHGPIKWFIPDQAETPDTKGCAE